MMGTKIDLKAISKKGQILTLRNDFTSWTGFLLEKNLTGGGAKDNRPLFFKTIGYCFYCFFENLGGQKSFWGAPPAPPRSRKPVGQMSRNWLVKACIAFRW